MKISNYLILSTALLVFACGQEADTALDPVAKKQKLIAKKDSLNNALTELNKEISKYDTIKIDTVPVKVIELKKAPFASYVEVYGKVESGNNVLVNPETMGQILKIYVKEGQYVKKGQLIAKIDDQILRNNLDELKTRLDLAKDLYERQSKLREQNVGSEVQYLQAKNNMESIERSIETLRAQISKTTINSPINGKVDEIFPKAGEMATTGSPLVRIVNTKEGFYIEADVSEVFFNKLKEGDDVEIDFSSIDQKVSGKVTYIASYINPANRTFKIRVSLPNGKGIYAPNMLAILKLRDEYYPEAISVPMKTVGSDKYGHYIYLAEEMKNDKGEPFLRAVQKHVQLGVFYDNQVVIKDEVEEGSQLVTAAIWSKLGAEDNMIKIVSK